MSFSRIDDLLPHHDKVIRAGRQGPAVFGLYVASICYAQRHLTDGQLPRQALALLLPGCPRPPANLIAALVALRLWDQTPTGWRVHDYLDHNPPAMSIRARREAESERKRRWRHSGTDSGTDAGRDAGRTPVVRAESVGRPRQDSDKTRLRRDPDSISTSPDGFSAEGLGPPVPEPPTVEHVKHLLAGIAARVGVP